MMADSKNLNDSIIQHEKENDEKNNTNKNINNLKKNTNQNENNNNNSKLLNSTGIIKKLIPNYSFTSGSYNLDKVSNDFNNNRENKLLKTASTNDIELNSAHPIDENNNFEGKRNSETNIDVNNKSSNKNNKGNDNLIELNNLDLKESLKINPKLNTNMNLSNINSKNINYIKNNLKSSHFTMNESFKNGAKLNGYANYPSKNTCFGIPLMCCTYFAAIYSLLAYGATSLYSIIQLMFNSSILLPLYILLVGYLLITLMSFLLIVAIQKNWFSTTNGFYSLVALLVRVTIDIPCIIIVLFYHINRTKRNDFLKHMLKPIKKNIMNGEALKRYNDISVYKNIDEKDQINQCEMSPPPLPPNFQEKLNSENLIYENSSSIIMPNIDMPKLTCESMPRIINVNHLNHSNDNYHFVHPKNFNHIPITDDNTQTNFGSNSLIYRFDPKTNFSIQLRPSKDDKFLQRFVNINEVKLMPKNTPSLLTKSYRNIDKNLYTSNNGLDNYKYNIEDNNQNFHDPNGLHLIWNQNINKCHDKFSNDNMNLHKSTASLNHLVMVQTDKYEQLNYSAQKSMNDIFKSDNIYSKSSPKKHKKQSKPIEDSSIDRNETPIPIHIEESSDSGNNDSFNKRTINQDLSNEQYFDLISKKNKLKSINYSNHHIYLPPAPTLGVLNTNDMSILSNPNDYVNTNKIKNDANIITNSNSNECINGPNQMTTLLQGTICNCINIASCNKDEINCFIHSNDCILNEVTN